MTDSQPQSEPGRSAQLSRESRGRRIARLLVVFFALVIVVDALVGDRGLLAMFRARHQYEELAASISRLQAENVRLREEARRLREDPTAIEELARRELGLIRPGERVFIIKDLQSPPTQTSNSPTARQPESR